MNASPILHYELGDFVTQAGETIPNAFLAYKTFGNPSNPVICYPTWFSGSIADNEWLISTKHKSLNPEKYFIVIPAMLGNGESPSPSNSELSPFPATSMHDNVLAQHRLLTHHLRIPHLFATIGWSMGAGQTFQWATSFPSFSDCYVPFCGAARTAEHNQTFIRSLISALKLDEKWDSREEQATEGKKAFSAIYSAWGLSQTFYRQQLYRKMGFETLDSFLSGFWEPLFANKDARNLIHMLNTWHSADITCTPSRSFNHSPSHGRSSTSSFISALRSITAPVLILPSSTDLYFPPEDSEFEALHIPNAELKVIPSFWGHLAGVGANEEDTKWIDEVVGAFFEKVEARKAGGGGGKL